MVPTSVPSKKEDVASLNAPDMVNEKVPCRNLLVNFSVAKSKSLTVKVRILVRFFLVSPKEEEGLLGSKLVRLGASTKPSDWVLYSKII